VRRRS